VESLSGADESLDLMGMDLGSAEVDLDAERDSCLVVLDSSSAAADLGSVEVGSGCESFCSRSVARSGWLESTSSEMNGNLGNPL